VAAAYPDEWLSIEQYTKGRLNPSAYLEATARHKGLARFDADGNIVAAEGKPWIGGNPFPEPTSALEVFAAHTLSWGRHDVSVYATRETDSTSTRRYGPRWLRSGAP
jgi:hypothetical protein